MLFSLTCERLYVRVLLYYLHTFAFVSSFLIGSGNRQLCICHHFFLILHFCKYKKYNIYPHMSRISSNACTQQQSSERSRQLLPNWGTNIPTPFLPPWLQPPHEMPSPLLIPMSMAEFHPNFRISAS